MALAGCTPISRNAERPIRTVYDIQLATLSSSIRLEVVGVLPSVVAAHGNAEHADVLPGRGPY
jgi:hypothetical protein